MSGAQGPRPGGGGGAGHAGLPLTPRPAPAVFIYSMPGCKCSIRERMLYSSCKGRLLDAAEQDFQLEIAKKVGAAPTGWGWGGCARPAC